MTKRIKVKLNSRKVENLEQADATLARMAEIKRSITLETAALDERVAELTLDASERLSEPKRELEELEQALASFAVENRKNLFSDTKKTVVLNFGSFGITSNPPALDTIGKTTQEQVVQMLLKDGLGGYIRTEEKLDKDVLKHYGELRDSSERALARYVKRIAKVDRLQWLTVKKGQLVIETLKKWVARIEDKILEEAVSTGRIDLMDGFTTYADFLWACRTGHLNDAQYADAEKIMRAVDSYMANYKPEKRTAKEKRQTI